MEAMIKHHGADHALMLATEMNDIAMVLQLIVAGAVVNYATSSGFTVLMEAAECDHPEITQLLLQNHAAVDARDDEGTTALGHAAHGGCSRVMTHLLNAGADVNIANAWGETPLMATVSKHTSPVRGFGETDAGPRIAAAAASARLLIAAGADLDRRQNNEETALITALKNGHEAVAIALICAGADETLPDHMSYGVDLKCELDRMKNIIAHE